MQEDLWQAGRALQVRLEGASCFGSSAIIRQGGSIVRSLAKPGGITPMLTQLVDNPNQLRRIASRSYYHSLGFLKVVLLTGYTSDWKFRLHIWGPGDPAVEDEAYSDIHTHRWDFVTAVVSGSYQACEFNYADERGLGAAEYSRWRYEPVQTDGTYSLTPTGNHYLFLQCERDVVAGASYYLDHRVPHATKLSPDSPTAVSVLVQSSTITASTDVFRPNTEAFAERIVSPVRRPTEEDLREHLCAVIEMVAGA